MVLFPHLVWLFDSAEYTGKYRTPGGTVMSILKLIKARTGRTFDLLRSFGTLGKRLICFTMALRFIALLASGWDFKKGLNFVRDSVLRRY